MVLNIKDYRQKVLGCWMGKNIGGTLGFPMEWKRQINDVTFYEQELSGEPMPNDDLDIQLLWLIALEQKGIDIDAHVLAEYWLSHLTPYWVEYGNSKAYMTSGLMPPLCSIPNNPHKDSCGSFIRSEIWACITPGAPDLAAKYAYEDSILDHGAGEGIYAEIFCATIESAAFIETDMYKLIDIGLSYIPEDCGIAKAINTVIECFKEGRTWLECRDEVMARHRGPYWPFFGISDRDRDLGFADGSDDNKWGYDAPLNIAFLMIGWIYGENNFGNSLCITVNCGEDTDCTAATLGSILGIINGFDAIPHKWIEPIGRGIKTLCLNLGDVGGAVAKNIDELCERVERIAKIVMLTHKPQIKLSETEETCISESDKVNLFSNEIYNNILSNVNGPVYRFSECDVYVNYPDGPFISKDKSTRVVIKLMPKFKHQMLLNIKLYNDNNDIVIMPNTRCCVFNGSLTGIPDIEFIISSEAQVGKVNRFAVELTADGRPTVMLVPIILLADHVGVY